MKMLFRGRRCLAAAGLSIVISLGTLLFPATGAQAEGGFVGGPNDSGFLQVYPDAGLTLREAAQNCSLCHTNINQSSARNAYGQDLQPASNNTINARLVAVEQLNSDGDTVNDDACDNITEINADTLPGDAGSTPLNCGGAANNPPAAVDDLSGGTAIATTPLNTPVVIDVLANDTDVDADLLTVNDFDTESANGGSVSCSLTDNTPTPQCTFTPAVNVCGSDTFTYNVTDSIDVSLDRATVTVDVGDANAPIVTAPTPDPLLITLPAGTDPATTIPASDPEIAAWLSSATANDPEEGPVDPVNNNAPTQFSVGTTPVTFSATDSCGNTGSAAANVTIQIADNTIPVVTAPAPDPLTVTAPLCATSVPQSATADNFAGTIVDWLGTATANDAEDGALAVNNNAPIDFPLGNTSVTFSATDSQGSSGTVTATVSVAETPNTDPVVTVPTPDPLVITLPPGSTGPVPATDPTIADWLASASASDAEDGTLMVSNDAPADFPIGTTVVNFTATDSCGVITTASASVTIEVQGNTTPVVTAPDPLTVDAPLCATSIPTADEPIASWLASATANDAEDGALPVSNDAPADFPIGESTVTFSALDSGGATGTATSTGTVNNTNTAPQVNAPAPLTLTVPAGSIPVPAADPQIAAWLASATATDAEDGGILGVSNDAPDNFPLGTTTVTFTATDSCNVTSSTTSTVTIQEEVESVGADVYLNRLQVPNRLNVRKGQVVTRKATARGDGTQFAQDATVVLSAVASPNVGVVVEPVSVTEEVVPGNPRTRFGFTVVVSCKAGGRGTVDWTATIDAAANDDPGNDVVTGTTSVRCAGRGNDGDRDDHDDHDESRD